MNPTGPVRLGKFGPAIVMEYVRGMNLWNFIKNHSRGYTRTEWLQLCVDLAEGLYKIHKSGFLHNDLKMDNILLQKKKDGTLVSAVD